MANDRPVAHSDGTTFSDGTGYAPTTQPTSNAWRLHGLAKAVKQLAIGKRLTPHQIAALDGIINEAERLP